MHAFTRGIDFDHIRKIHINDTQLFVLFIIIIYKSLFLYKMITSPWWNLDLVSYAIGAFNLFKLFSIEWERRQLKKLLHP